LLAVPYLIAALLAGFVVVQALFPRYPVLVRCCGAFVAGLVITGWATFAGGWAASFFTGDTLVAGALFASAVNGAIIGAGWRLVRLESLRMSRAELLVLAGSLAFSFWLMDARLSGDPLTVSLNTWGDNALHIGIARSFSWGSNYPPEFPIFGNEPIRYHFGMDFIAGALERTGLNIAWAFNLPGALGFAAMMLLVFEIGRFLFGKIAVGVMAGILLITNGSLAFIRYFQQFGDPIEGLKPENWWNHDRYIAIAPYQAGEQISLFWTLNVFLTQTHLIVSMALVLFVSYVLMRLMRSGEPLWTGQALALGALTGGMFWINGVLFVPAMVFFAALFFFFNIRWRQQWPLVAAALGLMTLLGTLGATRGNDVYYQGALAVGLATLVLGGRVRESLPFFGAAGLIALPQIVWLNGGLDTEGSLQFHSGYLYDSFRVYDPGTYLGLIEYWFLNLGLVLPLIVLAALLGSGSDRRMIAAIMMIFVFGNFVQLGRDLGGHNHKVFNLWEILINVFAAFAFVRLWSLLAADIRWRNFKLPKREINAFARVLAPAVFIVLVLSGLLDFMTLRNDPRFLVFGNRQNAIEWIGDNTPRDALFLTTYNEVYTTPTLAGRRVFLGGFDPWTGDKGYDTEPRKQVIASVYGAGSKEDACRLLRENDIDYVQFGPAEAHDEKFPVNAELWGQFSAVYQEQLQDGPMIIYDVARSCPSEGLATG
jgi:hypothetical protein